MVASSQGCDIYSVFCYPHAVWASGNAAVRCSWRGFLARVTIRLAPSLKQLSGIGDDGLCADVLAESQARNHTTYISDMFSRMPWTECAINLGLTGERLCGPGFLAGSYHPTSSHALLYGAFDGQVSVSLCSASRTIRSPALPAFH